MDNIVRITGKLIYELFDKDGNLKQRGENHNIVPAQGDSLIADALALTPARTKFAFGNGYMVVGTGWTGVSTKTNTWVNTQTGLPQAISAGYPQLQAAWGNAGSSTLITVATFPLASLNVVGINEAALVTASTQGASTSCLAYAQVVPTTNVTSSDTFQITWQIIFLGS